MKFTAQEALHIVRSIRADVPNRYVPPSNGTIPQSQSVLPHAIFFATRGYIEKVVYQINGAYEQGWFDACAVMMRRLIETLIIECFEAKSLSHKIKKSNTGNFLYLADLVSATLSESSWNLGRTTKKALPKLKLIGDQSAHSRRYNAHREDIDKVRDDFRIVCQELLYLSGLK